MNECLVLSWPSSFWARHLFTFPLLPGMHTPWSLAPFPSSHILFLQHFRGDFFFFFSFRPCCMACGICFLTRDWSWALGSQSAELEPLALQRIPSRTFSMVSNWGPLPLTPSCTSFFDTQYYISPPTSSPSFFLPDSGELSLNSFLQAHHSSTLEPWVPVFPVNRPSLIASILISSVSFSQWTFILLSKL